MVMFVLDFKKNGFFFIFLKMDILKFTEK